MSLRDSLEKMTLRQKICQMLLPAFRYCVPGAPGSIPYMFAIDQEGGRVSRLVGGTRLAGNMALGAAGDEDLAFESAEVIGTELSEVGFNLDFAPGHGCK